MDTIMDLLSEERIAREIDEPIEWAADTFQEKINVPISHPDFKRVIAKFVQRIYEQGLRLPRRLSEEEALTEAVSLLEKYYRGIYTKGYDGALLDAASNNIESMEYVLSTLKESMKTFEREKYKQWVFVDTIDQLDWEAYRRLAEFYLRQHKDLLPPELLDIGPARLADHFQKLI